MSIYTNWDPLEEVIVGNCVTESNAAWNLQATTKLLFDRILRETKEDLDNLADYLTKLNVKVLRPDPSLFPEEIDFSGFKIRNPTQPIVPRDQYFVYDKTIYQTYTSMPDRYVDSYSYYNIFRNLFNQGYNWLSQPPPMIKNFPVDSKWYTVGEEIYSKELADKMLWHTATMYKCGDTLITNTKGPGSQLGLEWMKRNIDAKIINNNNNYTKNFGHIDHGFYMIDDETVICLDEDWLPESLKNKKIINLKGLYLSFDYEKFTASTNNGTDKLTTEWLDKWFTEWKGYAQKVAFEANVLVVDSKNIIFSTTQPAVFKLLNSHGINCHVCEIRHGLFWEAGIHCLTLDIKRNGQKRKIV
jgi:glycine amidinotransferase